MYRITEKMLQSLCDELNKAIGSSLKPRIDGKPQADCYYLNYAYGGVALHRMGKESNGAGASWVTEVFGRGTKREIWEQMQAFMDGLGAGRATKETP